MHKVLGFGGFFFRANDPEALGEWYEETFGITKVGQDYAAPTWQQDAGTTVFAPFSKNTAYFGDPDQQWMINLRVHDLDATVASLKKASCPSCGENRTYPYLTHMPVQFTTLCGRDAVQVRGDEARDLERLEQNLSPVVSIVAKNPYLLSFKTETHRFVAFRDGRVLIHGEQELVRAKQLYHAFFG